MRAVYLLLATCLPLIGGTISASVAITSWPSVVNCAQSSNDPTGLSASASCSALGSSVSAYQYGWNANVSTTYYDWARPRDAHGTVSYGDSLIITGDTGSGFIDINHFIQRVGHASVTYYFAGNF